MRALIVSRVFAPEAAAAAFRLRSLAHALAASGWSVEVLTASAPTGMAVPDEPREVSVRRSPVLRDRSGYVRGYLPYLSFDIPAFFRGLVARRPDVVVVEPPPTTGAVVRLVSALRRVPYVYYAADIWSDASASTGAPAIVVSVVRALEAFALRGAASVIAVSDGVAARVRALAPHARVEVVANGVDTTVFRPDGRRVPDVFGVYAGTASEWQGADVFVRALARMRADGAEGGVVFVGNGSAWPALRELADRLVPGAVEFVPTVPPERAAQLLRSARVGLVSLSPGAGYDFAVPTKICATAATGTPVLFAGPGPAATIVVQEGLGVAVDHDVDAVARSMREMFEHVPSDRERAERAASVDRLHSARAASRRAAEVVAETVRR